jgi:hypothetical protein
MSVKVIKKLNKFVVYSNYDKKLLDLVKSYPESKWDSKNREWIIPNRFYNQFLNRLQQSYFRHEFDFDEENADSNQDLPVIITSFDDFIEADFNSNKINNELTEFGSIDGHYIVGETMRIKKDELINLLQIILKNSLHFKLQDSKQSHDDYKTFNKRESSSECILGLKKKKKISQSEINHEGIEQLDNKNEKYDKMVHVSEAINRVILAQRKSMLRQIQIQKEKQTNQSSEAL